MMRSRIVVSSSLSTFSNTMPLGWSYTEKLSSAKPRLMFRPERLSGLSGVERVHVELPTGRVRVLLDARAPASREQLVKAIDDSGFTLDRVEMP